jgi:glycosyltransferase involved in cell wall biosynthesis
MRILTIAIDLNPGGAQRVARNFTLGYQRYGAECAYFGYEGGGPLEARLAEHGIPVFAGSREPAAQAASLARALAWRPDVVHIHRPGASDSRAPMLRAIKAASRPGTQAPVGIVETNFFGRVDYSPDRQLIDVHYLISRWCLWKWRRWASVVAPRPVGILLPNLVMHEEFPRPAPARGTEFRRVNGIPEEALVFGRIGSPSAAKWSAAIFSAFAEYGSGNANAWLLLVGLPPELKDARDALPADLRRRICTIDFLADDAKVIDAYSAMDVFLHAAHIGETFGMVFAEALLCGVPVITLGTPERDNGQLEIVGHEWGGLVVTDAAAMVEAMRRLEDPQLRDRYAGQGAAEIARNFGEGVLMPIAMDVARLVAEGLPREVLRRRLLARPGICTDVRDEDIEALLGASIGRYGARRRLLMNLVNNPYFYRFYSMAMVKAL